MLYFILFWVVNSADYYSSMKERIQNSMLGNPVFKQHFISIIQIEQDSE